MICFFFEIFVLDGTHKHAFITEVCFNVCFIIINKLI